MLKKLTQRRQTVASKSVMALRAYWSFQVQFSFSCGTLCGGFVAVMGCGDCPIGEGLNLHLWRDHSQLDVEMLAARPA